MLFVRAPKLLTSVLPAQAGTCPRLSCSGSSTGYRSSLGRVPTIAGMTILFVLLGTILTAHAEPVLDRILSGARVTEKGACALLKIDFNIRIRYISHFPGDKGNQLSIKIAAIDAAQARNELISRREAIPAPRSAIANIRSIEFDANSGTEPALIIAFKTPMAFSVAAGKDFQSVIIAIAPPGKKPCAPVLAGGAAGGTWSTSVSAETLPPAVTAQGEAPSKGKLSAKDRAAVSALMDRARETLGSGSSDAAIRYLTRVLGYPKNEVTQEATELLGVAHQRKGEIAKARVLYQDYLAKNPPADDAKRVGERLASLDNAPADTRATGRRASRESRLGTPGQPSYVVNGSFSQFYLRDDGFRNFNDPTKPPPINAPADAHNLFQNEVLSSFDTTAQWGDANVQNKFRFSGASENGLSQGDRQIASLATLELDTSIKDWGLATKLGRQTRNTGGVLGRFDGGVLSYQAWPNLRFDTVVGSPVLLRRDLPYKNGSLFYGEALNFGPLFGAFDTTVYAIEQRTAGLVDRQAVGAEVRYADAARSAFASIDYDTHFQRLGSAIANGTWTFEDKSTFTVSAEHRGSPGLLASNALIGQPFGSLSDMLGTFSANEIDRLALDRTAYADTASVGFSRPINEHLQVSLDAAWFNLTGTPASGGVDAVAATGNEWFFSGQLTGTDLFKPTDLYVLGLRYATAQDTKTYVADLSARYPVTDKLALNPRLRLGYRQDDVAKWEELSAVPSLRLDYQWTRDWNFELEGGAKLARKLQAGTRDDQSEVFVTVGYRYDFNAEGAVVGGK